MVELTEAYGQLAVLISRSGGEDPPSVRITEKLQGTVSFSPVTAEGAADPRSPVAISGAGETAACRGTCAAGTGASGSRPSRGLRVCRR
jgi:hypothetical protein